MDERFNISFLLRPIPGGPHMGAASVYNGSREQHMKELASTVRYIKVGALEKIDLTTLISDWTLNPRGKEIFEEFKYHEFAGLVPHFVGKGHLWSAAFSYDGLLHTWASVDCTTALDFVINLARQYYEHKALHRGVSHRLLFVMKTSWEESSYKDCAYEIYVPQNETIPEKDCMEPKLIDALCDPEYSRATWTFCGAFPFKEVGEGRRACRATWRSGEILGLGGTPCMLAVFLSKGTSSTTRERTLYVEWEYEDIVEGGEEFSFFDSLQAKDWYIEDIDSPACQ